MKTICTWEDCLEPGEFKQIATDGEVWANLCDHHNQLLDKAPEGNYKMFVAYWIKAQGGAKKAAKRMMGNP